jgi:uncharacterized cofD-like protein
MATAKRRPIRVVTIGGGTGSYTLLRGLRQYHHELDISAIVAMTDSGGSTGRLRDEFGYLPVGDVRMALCALASIDTSHQELVRDLFQYRFAKGDGLSGHTCGNLLLTALTDILGSETEAIAVAGRMLDVVGCVLPVTEGVTSLVAEYQSGRVVVGEHDIDVAPPEHHHDRITSLYTSEPVHITAAVADAIVQADYIVFGPGDLYTSILANCVIGGMKESLEKSQATKIYVSNLMARGGQTIGMNVCDYVEELFRYTGTYPDVVITPTSLPTILVDRYQSVESVHPVAMAPLPTGIRVITTPLVTETVVEPVSGDVVPRSLLRHDTNALTATIMSVLHSDVG